VALCVPRMQRTPNQPARRTRRVGVSSLSAGWTWTTSRVCHRPQTRPQDFGGWDAM